MKTLGLFFSVFCFSVLFSLSLDAQILVDSIGRVKTGQIQPPESHNDYGGIVTMQMFGKGPSASRSILSMGDFGSASMGSLNVLVGEYGTTDTDQLWLHGKRGMYFTYSNGPVWAYFNPQVNSYFNVNCQIKANGVLLSSDARLKENIEPLAGSLSLLQQLKGVSYHLKNTEFTAWQSGKDPEQENLTDKERQDMAFFENLQNELETNPELRIGFVAQELREVFPELVREDKEGMLSVDYIGLIPVIVESIKEQQQKIKDLEAALAKLQGTDALRSGSAETSGTDNPSVSGLETAVLYQNAPNPFKEQTEIRYFLPQAVQQAYIYIFDMQGQMLKKLDAFPGDNALTIRGSELQAGMYLYSLIADGKEVDTKRMILTK